MSGVIFISAHKREFLFTSVFFLLQSLKDHVCPTYSCPSGYAPIAKWPLKIESTGCAAVGSMGSDTQSGMVSDLCLTMYDADKSVATHT